MAAAVAHEVKNVLTPIQLRTEVLLCGAEDPAIRRDLEGMRDEVSRGATMLRSLLEFAGTGSRELRAVDTGEVLTRTAELLRPQLQRNGVKLVVDADADQTLVWGDQAQLLQVLANLLNNAGDAGARNITMQAHAVDTEVVITVTDDGAGMDQETLDRAMEPFFTTKPSGKGTGLGLSICHSVVEAHGGDISVESSRHLGTRVVVTLPTIGAS